MRIKINADVLSKSSDKTQYKHDIYSMILTLLPTEWATKIHDENKKTVKFFTFSNVYISQENSNSHFYISGEDVFISEIIKSIQGNTILKLGDLLLDVNNISECPKLVEKRNYLFKGEIIASNFINGKKRLIEDDEEFEDRLRAIASKKLDMLGVDGKVDFELIQKKFGLSGYKGNVKIANYRALLLVKGDYKAIRTLYDIGFGENTATGHGLVWEV